MIEFENKRRVLEQMFEVYLRRGELAKVQEVLMLLEREFPADVKLLVYKMRFADINGDYESVINLGNSALKLPEEIEPRLKMLIHHLLGYAYDHIGNAIQSAHHYRESTQVNFSTVTDKNLLEKLRHERREDFSNYLFVLHNLSPSQISSEQLFSEISKFNELVADIPRYNHNKDLHRNHDKIRLGYISPDLRYHVAAFFSYHLFRYYDQSKFEVYCYAKCPEDALSLEIKSFVDGWRNIANDDSASAAAKIFNDEIDILIDLAGHTANNCLEVLAYKPAPIQISAIGWFNSTGLNAVDFFIADRLTVPDERINSLFTEVVLRLRHSHFCYTWHGADFPVVPAPCLKNGYVTFGSFNNFAKVTDEILIVWSDILNAVPKSKLFLKSTIFNSDYARRLTLERLNKAGINIDRVRLEGSENNYLIKYQEVDIALDTFPYVGGGTTCDALYMGVPVITLIGDRHASRFGYSILSNVGLNELCAATSKDYVNIAIELANDCDRINAYHLSIREMMEQSPLMNYYAYLAELELILQKVFAIKICN